MQKIIEYSKSASAFVDSLGVESKGIHRYMPNERYPENSWKAYISTLGLWISGCGGLTSMSSFFLGPLLFKLGYKDTIICGLFGLLLGCLVAAYCATMGPRSGLRQMCSARYLFGPWMVRFVSLITIIGFLGWSITNSVLGGEILKWLSGGKLSLTVGIVIVSIVSLVVALFGIEYVLKFEGIIGCFVLLVVFLLYIIADNKYPEFEHLETIGENTITKIGNRISFFTLAYSVTATWGGCAADYYVVFPESISQVALFIYTFFATAIPTTFGAIIGMLIGNAAVGDSIWSEVYSNRSLGGLLNVVFERWGNFGKFLVVILWLSLITNNIINNYSSALAVQLLDDWAYRHLSRWFIVIIIFAITLICSLVGKDHFSEILSNFLPMLGYWISIYFTLLIEENVIFRSTKLIRLFRKELYDDEEETSARGDVEAGTSSSPSSSSESEEGEKNKEYEYHSTYGSQLSSPLSSNKKGKTLQDDIPPPFSTVKSIPYYNFDAWNDKVVLTHGIAATFAFCCGVAGAIVGMNQAYYIGPIAKLVGDDAADLGMFFCIGFTGVAYPLTRWMELRYFKK